MFSRSLIGVHPRFIGVPNQSHPSTAPDPVAVFPEKYFLSCHHQPLKSDPKLLDGLL
jgi:hypothetical protein